MAAKIKDLGISQGRALDLLLGHWNERCSPPWHPDELAVKVANAYRYGQEPPGSKSPEADFGPAGAPLPETHLDPNPVTPFDWEAMPPRRWILENLLIRGFVTELIAQPGMGKSTFVIGALLAIATGRGEITGLAVKERTRAWYFNNEDDDQELQRRLGAAMKHHGVAWPDLLVDGVPGLYLNSGVERPLTIATRGGPDGKKVVAGDVDAIIERIRRQRIGVFVADPLIETWAGDENDNAQMGAIGRLYRRIAVEADCAVVIVHHTRKPGDAGSDGHAGNMNASRGGGSLLGVARVVYTLEAMSERQGKKYGIADDDWHRYVRLDSAKGNLTLAGGKTRWFERVSVEQGVSGETVGALAVVELQRVAREPAADGSSDLLKHMLAATDGAHRTSSRTLLARLRERYEVYAAVSSDTLRKRVNRELPEAGAWVNGVRMRRERATGTEHDLWNFVVDVSETSVSETENDLLA